MMHPILQFNHKIETEKKPKKRRYIKINRAEEKLISIIRSIAFGEIEGLKIKNGVPVNYRIAKKTFKC